MNRERELYEKALAENDKRDRFILESKIALVPPLLPDTKQTIAKPFKDIQK